MSRAALYDRHGGPDVLYVGEATDPGPGRGEVAIRVRAAGLNPFDTKMRSGSVSSDRPFPRRVGSDLAGTVEATGAEASYWDGKPVKVGDEVLGSGSGAVAERSIASAAALTRRPDGLSLEVAAGLNVPGLTAVSCLATVPVEQGDTVLVGGATGAVGLVVTQLAVAAGATVIGTASSRNHDFVRSLGGVPVSYGEGLADRVAPHGPVTAVIDGHGREALDAGVRLGVPPDRMTAIAACEALEELGVRNVERDARTAENLAGLAAQAADGSLVFPVAASFSLDDVVAAFEALESSHPPGKIIVLP